MSQSIQQKLRDPGFTPGRRDVGPLLELLAACHEDDATKIIRTLAGVTQAVERAAKEWPAAAAPLRHRLVGLVARSGTHDEALALALRDEDPRTRKAAARGLGRRQGEPHAAALRAALGVESRPEVRRAVIEALGKTGSASDKAMLARLDGDDSSTDRVRREAEQRLERSSARETKARIAAERVVPPFEVELRCRTGLEAILAGEVKGAHVASPGLVRAETTSLEALAVARVWSTAAIVLGSGSAVDVAAVLREREPLLRSLTDGIVRWRVEWAAAGHRRAATRALAEAASHEGFINDPIAADWEIEVHPDRVVAIPKSWDDGRFAYRVADVPAASHPTIAAAIARLGGVRDDDVVWDPFVGSGLELVERARLGPYRTLMGTDTDERALAAAKKNLASAHVRDGRLERADARTFRLRGVSLVLTNPPMGRRVQTPPRLDDLLTSAIENVAAAIASGGRLVWITPHPRTTNRVLERAGMKMTKNLVVDMRGFAANLQHWKRCF